MPNQFNTPSPWLVGLLPWVIDLLFRTSFLNSLWGALLWGLLLVVYFAGARLKDPRLKKNLNSMLFFLAVLWLVGWARALIYPIENPLKPSASLFFLHGTFLVAAAGMLLLVLGGALTGLLIERKIFAPQTNTKSTSQRRPSLEGVLNLCSWSLSLARQFWILGTFLSIVAVAVQIAHNHESWSSEFSRWLTNPGVWCVLSLAVILGFSKFYLRGTLKLRRLFSGYLVLSFSVLIILGTIIWVESYQSGHFRKEFLR